MLGEAQAKRIGDFILNASKADETEALILGSESALTRFAGSEIHQNIAESSIEIRVRAVLGKRIGVAASSVNNERALRDLVERAALSARHAPQTADFVGLPEPLPIQPVQGYAEATARYSAEQRARDVRVICREALGRELEASGAWSTNCEEICVMNSRGVSCYDRRTAASLKTVIMGVDSSGYAERAAVDASSIDVQRVGAEAIERALKSRDPIPVEPGVYNVVLSPYAVGTMLDYFAGIGMGALAVQEGRSFLAGHFGERLVESSITMWDDALDARGLPSAFDYEGVPKERVAFFENGVATGVVYDSYTAGREGKRSTGHGLPAPNSWGPVALNIFLAPGSADEEMLIRGIKRGLWVTRFHYVNVVQPMRAVLTGMTRDGTWLIEDGELTAPVQNLRFTQSVLDALNGVEAVGRDALMLQDEWSATYVPAMRLSAFQFSSATQF